jgi:acyl-CoA thioester hydrolase
MTANVAAAKPGEIESARTVVYPWQCMKIFDDAIGHLLGSLGYRFTDAPRTRRGWADVSHSIEYRHEIVAGDLIVAYSGIEQVGTKSLTYRTRLVRTTESDTLCASLRGVAVHFDLAQRCALVLPEPFRATALARRMPDGDATESGGCG